MPEKTSIHDLPQDDLVRLANLYGIHPWVTFEDVWPFGDPHDVGKLHPSLADKIIKREAEIAALTTVDDELKP